MIESIKNTPANVAAFRAAGEVTEKDYKDILVPEVEKLAKATGK